MPEVTFQVGARYQSFWSRIKSTEIRTPKTYLFFLGWIITFIILFFPVEFRFGARFLFYVGHAYFWYKLVSVLHKKLQPPNELLIAAFFIFIWLELALLRSIYATFTFFHPIPPSALIKLIQMVLLSALILLFSLLLVRNSEGKGGVLIGYVFLGLIGINLLKYQGFVYLLILQIILFIFLLRKTAWLEELTKIECWTYLVLVFFTFRGISKLNLFQEIEANQFEQALIWYTLPQFLYLLFKMYLLAVLVKLPIVLIYNFARLSRKLKISSLFQSTFPQIIQLFMLLLIFYFFIAGWQADKVREAMINQVDLLISGKTSTSINLFKVAQDKSGSVLHIKGYQPINFSGNLPPEGVLTVTKDRSLSNLKQVDYFLFFKSFDSKEESIYFVKLDSSFLQLISTNSSILTGSHLLAYPYQPPSWESYVYELTNWKQTHSIRIFPFGLTPQRKDDTLSARFNLNQQSSPEWIDTINKRITEHNQFTIGRVIAPLINLNMEQTGFFTFDILLLPDISFFTSTLLTYILFLVLIYFLVNLLVIRRMVKFGSEINQMIVQKFNQLRNGIREISTGNLDYKVKLEGRDEFVELAEHFNQMGDKLKESIAEAREKERLKHELTIARQVQLDMLPLTLPEIPGFQIAATLKTANEVGGDFYDMLLLNKNRYLFTVGDVSGKSTSAAFYMAQCISLIRYSPQFTDQPREIVLRLNKYFAGPLVDRQIFVTAIVGMLDVDSSTLRMVRAGHPLPIFIPGKKTEQLRELNYDGIGIGLERSGQLFEKNLENGLLTLKSGDMTIFYTDGVVEATRSRLNKDEPENEEMQFYGEERLMKLLKDSRDKNASEILKVLTDDIESFYGGSSPVDDYTLLAIQKTN